MAPHLSGEKGTSFSPAETPPRERPYVADDNINNGSSDEQLPEDLRRLLDRAQADDSGQDVYDPDAEGEDAEEDDDDGELEEEFGDGDRGVDTGETDEHGGTLQISEFGHEMRQSFIEYSMSVITARALPDVRVRHLPQPPAQEERVDGRRGHRQVPPAR